MTDPGTYEIKVMLSDDNPILKSSHYTLKIYVLPLAPVKEELPIVHPVSKIKSNPANSSKKLQVKIKSITPQALAIVNFNLRMRVPGNISAIDTEIMTIRVRPGLDSDPQYLLINSWTVIKFTEF